MLGDVLLEIAPLFDEVRLLAAIVDIILPKPLDVSNLIERIFGVDVRVFCRLLKSDNVGVTVVGMSVKVDSKIELEDCVAGTLAPVAIVFVGVVVIVGEIIVRLVSVVVRTDNVVISEFSVGLRIVVVVA